MTALNSAWCFYLRLEATPRTPAAERENRRVVRFQTAEEFFNLFNQARKPSEMALVDYSLFRNGVFPDRDHVRNGGRWTARVPLTNGAQCDEAWLSTQLALIGEQLRGGEVNGCVVAKTTSCLRMEVWVADEQGEADVMAIGRQFKAMLEESGLDVPAEYFSFVPGEHSDIVWKAVLTGRGQKEANEEVNEEVKEEAKEEAKTE